MAWIFADRVLDTSVTTGTGPLTLSGTPPLGWRTFSTVCAVADAFYYTIYDPVTGAWETGEGTYSAANTIARTTVRASTSANALVSFAANAKNVFIDVIGYWFGNLPTGGYLPLGGGTLTGPLTGTTATFSGAMSLGGQTTLTGTSATGGHLLFNDTNTGGQVWQVGPGAGTGSPDFWTIYNQGTAANIFHLNKNGALTLNGSLSVTGGGVFTGTVFAPGAQIQMVSVETGAVATGTTVIPFDDTVPQITEGDQYMTLAITPKSATSKLIIEVVWNGSHSVVTTTSVALFQDATANALAAVGQVPSAGGNLMATSLRHIMTSGTTSATTFRVRAGGNTAGTLTFNGATGARIYGGVMASSIVIREVAP